MRIKSGEASTQDLKAAIAGFIKMTLVASPVKVTHWMLATLSASGSRTSATGLVSLKKK